MVPRKRNFGLKNKSAVLNGMWRNVIGFSFGAILPKEKITKTIGKSVFSKYFEKENMRFVNEIFSSH